MKFANFEHEKLQMIGIINDENNRILPIKLLNSEVYNNITSINELLDINHEGLLSDLTELAKEVKEGWINLNEVKLCAPIPFPKRNIICLGKNYLDHAKETMGLPGGTTDIPKFPIYFTKMANPAIGQDDIIKSYPQITDKVDYEVELALIIGKEGRDIPKEEAYDYIFGYTIINDISARNIQRKHGQWFKGKSLDTHCPMGPYIVHRDELSIPVELDIKCSINGELRQDSNTSQLIFDIPYIIEDLSKGTTLMPGDIISTGTPSGVGLGFTPFKFLKSGDVIDCYIEGIGHLRNEFI